MAPKKSFSPNGKLRKLLLRDQGKDDCIVNGCDVMFIVTAGLIDNHHHSQSGVHVFVKMHADDERRKKFEALCAKISVEKKKELCLGSPDFPCCVFYEDRTLAYYKDFFESAGINSAKTHRSVLVNLDYVKKILNKTLTVLMQNDVRLPVSKDNLPRLRKMFW